MLGHKRMCGVELLQGMLVSDTTHFSMCAMLTYFVCLFQRLRGVSEEINFSASAINPLRSVNRRMSAVNQRELGMSISRNNRRAVLKRSVS